MLQQIATKIFMCASIAFGATGVILVIMANDNNDGPNSVLIRLLLSSVFIILASFAVSVAGKYLDKRV